MPIANLLYLGLSYAGGLWIRPSSLPHRVEQVSRLLPTRALADVLTAVVYGDPWAWRRWVYLAGFAVLFAALAAAGYRRDEGKRFR